MINHNIKFYIDYIVVKLKSKSTYINELLKGKKSKKIKYCFGLQSGKNLIYSSSKNHTGIQFEV